MDYSDLVGKSYKGCHPYPQGNVRDGRTLTVVAIVEYEETSAVIEESTGRRFETDAEQVAAEIDRQRRLGWID